MDRNETLSNSSDRETTLSPLKRLSSEFVLVCVPVLFSLSLFNNCVVLYAFGWPRRVRLRGSASVQLYCALLAAADLLVLAPFSYKFLGLWLPDSLRPFVRHDAGCKTAFYLGYVGESCSQWLLVALCAERLAALCWPLWSRRTLSFRRSLHICECIIVACAVVCVPAAVSFREGMLYAPTGCGNHPPPGSIYAPLMAYVTIAQKYAYGTTAMLALSVAIAVKLLLIGRDFRRASVPRIAIAGTTPSPMTLRVSAGEKVRRRMDMSAALTSIVIALLQSSLYLPRALLWGLNAMGAVRKSNTNLSVTDVGNVVDAIGLLVHTWNLYVYLLRVPELRDFLCGRICCKRSRMPPFTSPAERHGSQPSIISTKAAAYRSSSASRSATPLLAPSSLKPDSSPTTIEQFDTQKL